MSRLDPTLEPNGGAVRRIEVITGGGERRRRWSVAEKAQAVEESLAPGAVVSVVARRHGLAPQQLFSWRQKARRQAELDAVSFAPVVVERREEAPVALGSESRPVARPHVIELAIDGASVWIWRDAPMGMVTAIIDALKASS
ncbi:IS66-like element accessory protein TnpA [Methylocystis iwaonis]|uniref:IS66-like element accessory protein TnpA n=1 Tax=Methylocystis iwaonis TaxID=2885079 RepID=UPI0039B57ACF